MPFKKLLISLSIPVAITLASAQASDKAIYPTLKEDGYLAKDFKCHAGEVLAALKIHYTTLGNPNGEPVLVLYGTAGSGAGKINSAFAGELSGPGRPLDAARYFILRPDAIGIGTGKSSKPSDGLGAKFPRYHYDPMVAAQHALVRDHLGLKRLRPVICHLMGACKAGSGHKNTPTRSSNASNKSVYF